VKRLVAVLVVVLVILVGWGWARHDRKANEHALAVVASELAGRPVGVQCQGFWSELIDIKDRAGDVPFPRGRAPDHMYLTRKICQALTRFRMASSHPELECLVATDWSRWNLQTDFDSPCSRRARPAVEAINTLTHESMHLRGFTVEAETQCYALQFDAWTAVRLGATPPEGAALASFAFALQPALSTDYQSSGCESGGSFDLHPETSAFPAEAVPSLPPASLRGPALG